MDANLDVKDAVRTAMQMETEGRDFYLRAAEQTTSEMGKSIFNSLADDESTHLETFRRIFEETLGSEQVTSVMGRSEKYERLPVFPKDPGSVEGANPDSDELDAIHFAMDAEQHAIEFYSKMLEETNDEMVAQVLNEIIQQEKNHYLILNEEFTHITNTGYWYEMDYLRNLE